MVIVVYVTVRNREDAVRLSEIFVDFGIEADIGRPRISVDVRDVCGIEQLGLPRELPLFIHGDICNALKKELLYFNYREL